MKPRIKHYYLHSIHNNSDSAIPNCPQNTALLGQALEGFRGSGAPAVPTPAGCSIQLALLAG
jgi:hypothetical protein